MFKNESFEETEFFFFRLSLFFFNVVFCHDSKCTRRKSVETDEAVLAKLFFFFYRQLIPLNSAVLYVS